MYYSDIIEIKSIDPTGFIRVKMKTEYCIAQKDTQPSQTCSGGFIKTQLYAICCCFFAIGEYNRI